MVGTCEFSWLAAWPTASFVGIWADSSFVGLFKENTFPCSSRWSPWGLLLFYHGHYSIDCSRRLMCVSTISLPRNRCTPHYQKQGLKKAMASSLFPSILSSKLTLMQRKKSSEVEELWLWGYLCPVERLGSSQGPTCASAHGKRSLETSIGSMHCAFHFLEPLVMHWPQWTNRPVGWCLLLRFWCHLLATAYHSSDWP